MNRWYLFAGLAACCALLLTASIGAQAPGSGQPYQPAVPAPSTYNAYGGYYGGSGGTTPAGAAMNGMANAISAAGNYNLSTSAAAVNMTQAQSNEIQNHQQYTNTYFQMRETNEAYKKAHEKPRPTSEQLARLAREEAPQAPSPSEVNNVTNAINWPDVLMEDGYAQDRTTLEQLTAKQAAQGKLGIADQMTARKTVESMFAELKTQIRDVPPADYMASRDFLRSLIYATARSQLE